MNRSFTDSFASNEALRHNQPTSPAHPSLAGADRRCAAAPLLISAGTGSLYSLLLEQNIDAFWLLKLHTGQFGWLKLQPVYPILLGALTIVVTVSGMTMLLRPAHKKGS